MANQVISSVENNFTKGLVTEFTGLNFPENAATDCDNVQFTLVGDVIRRQGINLEQNRSITPVTIGVGTSTFIWSNAGGDGLTKLYVRQVGTTLYFYDISTATTTSPLSTQFFTSVNLSLFTVPTGIYDSLAEAEYAIGNGYLFVFHPTCDPVYCTYSAGVVSAARITVQIRDFIGVPEPGLADNARPTTLTSDHKYNLINQGWSSANPWLATSSTLQTVTVSVKVFTVAAGLPVVLGDVVSIYSPLLPSAMAGTVTAYAGTNLTVNVTSINSAFGGFADNNWTIIPTNTAYLGTWASAVGNYPSNADVWWYFKNAAGAFDPATTANNVSIGAGRAPRGHYILEAFNQQRDTISNLPITDIVTQLRPATGTWFQGRVWYTGVDAQQPATGDVDTYSWTENIYFSQIIKTPEDFGRCYQLNDPTSEQLFDLLPTDGGIIQIQGSGSIYKLFPIQNGLIVFATNGIWFITGSQGIGFTANDYTITKLSSIQSINRTSFINVMGLPYFWNEEGIYAVQPAQQGGLEVNPLTVGTILQFYNEIPFNSKKFVRGDYNPIDYVIQWTYRSTPETSVFDRYDFDSILNFNTYNKSFYPYSVSEGTISTPFINGVNYISYSQITNVTPEPGFKYPLTYTQAGVKYATFAEEYDTSYLDWVNTFGNVAYESFFTTGFKLHGQGQRRFQIPYIYVFSRGPDSTSYKIQSLWDYAITGNSGRWSTAQITTNNQPDFGMVFRRHRLRGQGLVLQIKVTSVDGEPFDIMGWSTFETQNTGV